MNFAFFIAKRPESLSTAWDDFIEKAAALVGQQIDDGVSLPQQGVFLLPMPTYESHFAKLLKLAADYEIESFTRLFQSDDRDLSFLLDERQPRPTEKREIEKRMDELAAKYGKTHDREVFDELQRLAEQLTELKRLFH